MSMGYKLYVRGVFGVRYGSVIELVVVCSTAVSGLLVGYAKDVFRVC